MDATLLLMVLVGLFSCQLKMTGGSTLTAKENVQGRQIPLEETCLNTKKCSINGGRCVNEKDLETYKCDKVVKKYCTLEKKGYPCTCCITGCSYKRCMTNGICKPKCLKSEFTQQSCCNACKCCEPCKATKCKGKCRGNTKTCKTNEFIEGSCEGHTCTCCLTCKPDERCKSIKGQCVNINEKCPAHSTESRYCGCTGGETGQKQCKCCVPLKYGPIPPIESDVSAEFKS